MFCFECINTSKKNIENILDIFQMNLSQKIYLFRKYRRYDTRLRRSTHDPTDAISFERREPTRNNLHILHIY